jgi:hypothetical protein
LAFSAATSSSKARTVLLPDDLLEAACGVSVRNAFAAVVFGLESSWSSPRTSFAMGSQSTDFVSFSLGFGASLGFGTSLGLGDGGVF